MRQRARIYKGDRVGFVYHGRRSSGIVVGLIRIRGAEAGYEVKARILGEEPVMFFREDLRRIAPGPARKLARA